MGNKTENVKMRWGTNCSRKCIRKTNVGDKKDKEMEEGGKERKH